MTNARNGELAKKRISGAESMKRTGKRPIQLWLTPDEMNSIRQAAARAGLSLASFAQTAALAAARNGEGAKP